MAATDDVRGVVLVPSGTDKLLTESVLNCFDKNNLLGSFTNSPHTITEADEAIIIVRHYHNNASTLTVSVNGQAVYTNSAWWDGYVTEYFGNIPVKKGDVVSISKYDGDHTVYIYGVRRK